MIQPALCAHTLLTVGKGPALVVGFQGYNQHDVPKRAQVLKYYETGLQRETQFIVEKGFGSGSTRQVGRVEDEEDSII